MPHSARENEETAPIPEIQPRTGGDVPPCVHHAATKKCLACRMSGYTAHFSRPDHFLLHLSDTHLVAGDELYGDVDSEGHLAQLFAEVEASGARPEAIIFTGDLADKGEAGAYAKLRAIIEPAAARLAR